MTSLRSIAGPGSVRGYAARLGEDPTAATSVRRLVSADLLQRGWERYGGVKVLGPAVAEVALTNGSYGRRYSAGTLRLAPADAAALDVADGQTVRLVTRRGSAVAVAEIDDATQPGHVSLPNGFGLDTPDGARVGVAPNELTSSAHRDRFAGTPLHKFVPARIDKL